MDTLTYDYALASGIATQAGQKDLNLATSGYAGPATSANNNAPCFFWGNLTKPYITATCLRTLSDVVAARFHLPPNAAAALRDPIVTAGNDTIRFEAFSSCCGIYARVDLLSGSHDGDFLTTGTTNVDFNQPMRNALSLVKKQENLILAVGKEGVVLVKDGKQIKEKKVKLPTRWIKGLTAVQNYMAEMDEQAVLDRNQAIRLFKSIPKGKVKKDYFFQKRGAMIRFSPIASGNTIPIGGIERIRLVERLLPLCNEVSFYATADGQSTAWQLDMDKVRFTLVLSREVWRGFSGEGKGLLDMGGSLDVDLLKLVRSNFKVNQSVQPFLQALEQDIPVDAMDKAVAQMGGMGLVGYDFLENTYFYRELPFKLDRIDAFNPRLKGAKKLIEDKKIKFTKQTPEITELEVAGSGTKHLVQFKGDQQRCTCQWYSKYQGERGVCKHILAAQLLLQEKSIVITNPKILN